MIPQENLSYTNFGLSDLYITEEEINLKYAAKLYFFLWCFYLYILLIHSVKYNLTQCEWWWDTVSL